MHFQGLVSISRPRQINSRTVALLLYAVALACLLLSQPAVAHNGAHGLSGGAISQDADPNKGPSEFNHHIAGWALIGVGVLALASVLSPGQRIHCHMWPVLFVLAGLFLALWSDGEIWPRGNLSWSWLLQHDLEARQHKIYSILLITIGTVEYLRIRGSLSRFWRTWAFPVIATLGAGMLLIHAHGAGSGADLPEAQAYLVNPALDVDGNPRELSKTPASGSVDRIQPMHNCCETQTDVSNAAVTMPMDHSQMTMDISAVSTVPPHMHLMNASMIRVERQHLWFMIVGLAIGLFKLISDSAVFRSRLLPFMWPGCMVLLGTMLVFYRE